ncbi:MAG: pyridoxal-dependent decarboxylase, partial [Ignavibacteriae bacterium]|nr:pyridoxal-dependent decarboxylase [Ignavibacteriota bacterium]
GAGMFFTRHRDILNQTFRITTDYMPKDGEGLKKVEPFSHSIQWSRRFTGLKVFMSLLVAGWDGYAEVIRHQTAMGKLLREELANHDWKILNDTPLPTVCFVDTSRDDGATAEFVDTLAQRVVSSGKAWISSTRLGRIPVLRACITNYLTTEKHIVLLVEILTQTRELIKL